MKTDAGCGVRSQNSYYPFGEQIDPPQDTIKYRFTDKERDSESGLDYFGARYYGSPIGRFTSADPLEAVAFDKERLAEQSPHLREFGSSISRHAAKMGMRRSGSTQS